MNRKNRYSLRGRNYERGDQKTTNESRCTDNKGHEGDVQQNAMLRIKTSVSELFDQVELYKAEIGRGVDEKR